MPDRHVEPRKDDPSADRPHEAPRDEETKLKPVARRIGEGPDNLRQRREWFKRRTGGSDE